MSIQQSLYRRVLPAGAVRWIRTKAKLSATSRAILCASAQSLRGAPGDDRLQRIEGTPGMGTDRFRSVLRRNRKQIPTDGA